MSLDIPLKRRVIARSLAHASLGISFAVALHFGPRDCVIVAAAALTGLFVLGEFVSFVFPRLRRWLRRQLDLFLRPEEDTRVTGATYFLIGITATMVVFPTDISVLAILFLALGDPVASAVGRWLGRTKLRAKNAEGHLACLIVCLLLAVAVTVWSPRPGLGVGAIGALAATLAQALPWRVNDNLTIPIGSAAVMFLVARMFGLS